ncbi:MAG: HAD family hydrolase [Pseudomonadota bacterium]
MPVPTIRGLLFDKDGTLFDFQATWRGVADTVIDTLGRDEPERDRMAAAVGFDRAGGTFAPGSLIVAGATSDIARRWTGIRTDLDAAEIEAFAARAALEVVNEPGTLAPASVDLSALLVRLKSRGLALGVATHDGEQEARAHLAAVGTLELFDFIAGYNSGHGLKPSPGMLTAFAAATGLAPETVAVIGDSVHDLEMVRQGGGALAIGVLTGPAGREDLSPAADHILPSIDALEALLDRLEGTDRNKSTDP